jgi:hypothetical protein
MLHRETVAVYRENLTKCIRKSTVWEKLIFFMLNLLLRIAWRSAKKWVVTFWDIRLSLSFYLLFHKITYTFTLFYAHPNTLYNSCLSSRLQFLIAFHQRNKSSYSSLATDVIRFSQRHDCFVPNRIACNGPGQQSYKDTVKLRHENKKDTSILDIILPLDISIPLFEAFR